MKTGKEYKDKGKLYSSKKLSEAVQKVFMKIIRYIDAVVARYKLNDEQRKNATNTELVNEIFAEIMLGNVGRRSKSKPAQKLDLWWAILNNSPKIAYEPDVLHTKLPTKRQKSDKSSLSHMLQSLIKSEVQIRISTASSGSCDKSQH